MALLLAGCAPGFPQALPALIPTAAPPPALTPATPLGPAAEERPAPSPTSRPVTATPRPSPVPSQLPGYLQLQLPAPAITATLAGGLRPADALQLYPPPLPPAETLEWRPPPLPAPHALRPDDHYWLQRPLPSDNRNYDLEWYPYGNVPYYGYMVPQQVHHGLDFPNDTGTSVFAVGSGAVIFAGPLPNRGNGANYYGNTVIIEHDWTWRGQPVYTLYAHTLELFVAEGDRVEQGQLLAGVGASGTVTGPHLHLEVRVGSNSYLSTRNPSLWLVPFQGWGTLAGRFVDNRGRLIHGATISVQPIRLETRGPTGARWLRTYSRYGPVSDEVWGENFVVADLPAGEYRVQFQTAGTTVRRDVRVLPGITNFIVVQADYAWAPTLTPTPPPTPSSTPEGSPTPAP